MATKTTVNKKNRNFNQKSTLEVLDELKSSTVKDTASNLKQIGSGILDDLLGGGDYDYPNYEDYPSRQREQRQEQKPKKQEHKLFNYAEHRESETNARQIEELLTLIKQEIEAVKKQGESISSEVSEIENLAIEGAPEKSGIYHVRFLEAILSILRTIREKIGDSNTWLAAMVSKKKKRGSLFAVRSKKMGTQYSLSQELQTTRAVQ